MKKLIFLVIFLTSCQVNHKVSGKIVTENKIDINLAMCESVIPSKTDDCYLTMFRLLEILEKYQRDDK